MAGCPAPPLKILRPAAIRRKAALCEAACQDSAQVKDLHPLLGQAPGGTGAPEPARLTGRGGHSSGFDNRRPWRHTSAFRRL